MSGIPFSVNLGGESEVVDVLNQQPLAAAAANWRSQSGLTLTQLMSAGDNYLVCPNDALALPDECVEIVYTNNVPIDQPSTLGPGVQSSEIRRILKSGAVWLRDGVSYYIKP